MSDQGTAIVPETRSGAIAGITDAYTAMTAFDAAIHLDAGLRELVKIRASTLNGCAFCVDMHTTEAHAKGKPIVAWRRRPRGVTHPSSPPRNARRSR